MSRAEKFLGHVVTETTLCSPLKILLKSAGVVDTLDGNREAFSAMWVTAPPCIHRLIHSVTQQTLVPVFSTSLVGSRGAKMQAAQAPWTACGRVRAAGARGGALSPGPGWRPAVSLGDARVLGLLRPCAVPRRTSTRWKGFLGVCGDRCGSPRGARGSESLHRRDAPER